MNFCKRAFISLWYRKRSFLVLFSVFLILSLLILTGAAALASSRRTATEVREQVGATVIVDNFNVQTTDIFYGSNLLAPETVETIAAHPLVTEYNPFVYSMAVATEDIVPVVSEVQKEKYGLSQNTWMRVEGTYELPEVADFVAGAVWLAEGRSFERDDKNVAVISADVASVSGIQVGHQIRLGAFYNEEHGNYHGQDALVEVVGIFAIQNPLLQTDAAFYNTENVIYVTPDVAFTLNGMENVYNVKYQLSDPTQAEAFVADIQAMGVEDAEHFEYTIDTTQYRSLQGSIHSMTQLAGVIYAAAVLMGGIVLVMLLMITMKDREFELGVLLSMGEGKGKIIAQMILEALVPVLLGMTAAVFCGGIGRQFLNGLFSGGAVTVTSTPATVLEMYAVGILLTLLSSCVTAWKVMRYQPKRILMAAG